MRRWKLRSQRSQDKNSVATTQQNLYIYSLRQRRFHGANTLSLRIHSISKFSASTYLVRTHIRNSSFFISHFVVDEAFCIASEARLFVSLVLISLATHASGWSIRFSICAHNIYHRLRLNRNSIYSQTQRIHFPYLNFVWIFKWVRITSA